MKSEIPDNYILNLPKPTEEGVRAFLSGSFIKGIGPVYAKKIIERFGFDILDLCFDYQSRLNEISGIPEKNIREFGESITSLKISPKILALLYSAGLNDANIEKIVSHYGPMVENVIQRDPYDMVENVWKFSFFPADKIGKFIGIGSDDPRRLRGAILTAVKFYAEEGNMFATEPQVLQTA